MKLLPHLTEKTLSEAKKGNYTFWVARYLTKGQIKKTVDEIFGVHTQRVRTLKVAGEMKRTQKGGKRRVLPRKKAIVTLAEKEKIDLFESKK